MRQESKRLWRNRYGWFIVVFALCVGVAAISAPTSVRARPAQITCPDWDGYVYDSLSHDPAGRVKFFGKQLGFCYKVAEYLKDLADAGKEIYAVVDVPHDLQGYTPGAGCTAYNHDQGVSTSGTIFGGATFTVTCPAKLFSAGGGAFLR